MPTSFKYRLHSTVPSNMCDSLAGDILLLLYHIDRYPYVTGTSVIDLKYKDGVIMASDTGGSSPVLQSLCNPIMNGNLGLFSFCILLWANFTIQEC
jgi:hypothetical protein